MTDLSPKEIVKQLDRYIISQNDAKKAVAIALRNRWRRSQVNDEKLKEEILPKNILMIGPTGVGKTEIARRLAKLANAPFIKVEATKFTEIGYVGRDVESIIRDLLDISIFNIKKETKKNVKKDAKKAAVKKILDVLVGKEATEETRKKFKDKIQNGEIDKTEIEIKVQDNPTSNSPMMEVPGMPGSQIGMFNLGDLLGGMNKKYKIKKLSIKDALKIVTDEEADKLIDEEKIINQAKEKVQNNGIVFIDEMDKICSNSKDGGRRGEVSREGVQRDLLPLIEGTTIPTKYGAIRTDHILFIASGAFHLSSPSDLLPELQGRLPIRVDLKPLKAEDFVKILTETEANLLIQNQELLKTEGLEITFEKDAVTEIAKLAEDINQNIENIGARRLHTLLEKLLEEISFDAYKCDGAKIKITKNLVEERLLPLTKSSDLSKFIL